MQLGRDRPSNLRLGPGYATPAIAQMHRAVAQRALDREPIEARAEQRFPEIALEAVLEEVGGAVEIGPDAKRLNWAVLLV
jgi:hypothetical protein